jgi:hypothetical protein
MSCLVREYFVWEWEGHREMEVFESEDDGE